MSRPPKLRYGDSDFRSHRCPPAASLRRKLGGPQLTTVSNALLGPSNANAHQRLVGCQNLERLLLDRLRNPVRLGPTRGALSTARTMRILRVL